MRPKISRVKNLVSENEVFKQLGLETNDLQNIMLTEFNTMIEKYSKSGGKVKEYIKKVKKSMREEIKNYKPDKNGELSENDKNIAIKHQKKRNDEIEREIKQRDVLDKKLLMKHELVRLFTEFKKGFEKNQKVLKIIDNREQEERENIDLLKQVDNKNFNDVKEKDVVTYQKEQTKTIINNLKEKINAEEEEKQRQINTEEEEKQRKIKAEEEEKQRKIKAEEEENNAEQQQKFKLE